MSIIEKGGVWVNVEEKKKASVFLPKFNQKILRFFSLDFCKFPVNSQKNFKNPRRFSSTNFDITESIHNGKGARFPAPTKKGVDGERKVWYNLICSGILA